MLIDILNKSKDPLISESKAKKVIVNLTLLNDLSISIG
jgi:hypothetical protein